MPEFGNYNAGAVLTLAAAAVGTYPGADQFNQYGRGAQVNVNLSAFSGSGNVTVHVQGKDTASGTYYDLLVSAALVATGFTTLMLYPGATVTANVSADAVLPATWRVQAVVTGSAVVTGTVGAAVNV